VSVRQFRPYPDYRGSGVEWLGEIPAHWEVKRLKHLSSVDDESLPEDTDPELEIIYVDIGNVDASAGIAAKERYSFSTAPSRARRVVRHGDVIVSTVRTYLKAIAAIVDPEPNLDVSTGFAVIRPRLLDFRFAAYALRAPYFVDRVVAHSVGVSYPTINATEMACFPIVFPALEEQHAIAAFLDRETSKIDALVAKKERLIELLQEKRTSLISHAVTKGLDPNFGAAKVGSASFSEMPDHWESRKLRRLIRRVIRPLVIEPNTEYREIGIRSWGKGIFHKDPVRGALLEDKSVYYIEPGDFVLNIVFAWEGAVAVVSEREVGMVASHRFPTFRHSGEVDLDYLLMVLQSEQGRALMAINSPGAAGRNRTIRLAQFFDEEIPLPPLTDQHEIVRKFRHEERRNDALLAKVREAIERLKEYRTALISAAVTGKIDVRGEAQ